MTLKIFEYIILLILFLVDGGDSDEIVETMMAEKMDGDMGKGKGSGGKGGGKGDKGPAKKEDVKP